MSDPGTREIQLSGKQLVFLFMASMVVALAVFLLGVSVGRGVRDATGGAPPSEAARASDGTAVAGLPPEVKPEGQDLRYHDQLKGQSAAAGNTPAAVAEERPVPGPPDEPPDVIDEPQQPSAAAPGATPPAMAKADAPKAASKGRAAAAPPADAAPAASGWSVQVGAYRSRDNANKQAADLKKDGLPAAVVPGAGNALFYVRVGPYSQRAEAERALGPLRAKFPDASITR